MNDRVIFIRIFVSKSAHELGHGAFGLKHTSIPSDYDIDERHGNLLSFDEQVKKLYIVSVNGAPLPAAATLRDELNRIFAPAVTRWDVRQASPVNVSFPNGHMTHGGSNVIEVYNADQKLALKAFGDVEKDAFYLFFVENVQGRDLQGDYGGYMPLQYRSGFIYGNPNAATVAHELAHGAFNLYHTFSSEKFVAAQNSTNNLMDYKGETELWKRQWKFIHDPQSLWLEFLQDEEEGERASWKIIDEKHTKLFNYVYDNNLNSYKVDGNPYSSSEWPEGWTYSDDKPEELVDKVIKKIKKAGDGKMVDTLRLANNRRSFIEATWIKLYNGRGSYNYYYIVRGETDDDPPEWHICDYATWQRRNPDGTRTTMYNYYVRDIGNRNTP